MWKLLLLFACVASFTIVYCDDNAESDDFDDSDTSFRSIVSSSKKSQSSSSLSSSQSSSSLLLTPTAKSLKSSKSSSSQSAASSSESSSQKIIDYTSKKRQAIDSNDDNASNNDASGSADVDTTAQVSTGADAADCSPQGGDDVNTAGAYGPAYKCGPNQVFSNCTNGGCDARNCSQAGKPVPCVKLDPKNCIKGCVCQSGYLRTKEGKCVPKDQCNEGCGNDANAHPGCGVNCGKTCEKRLICPRICKVDGCDCNDKYYFDSNLGKCVLQKDCTPICGINEVFSSCINGGCGYKNCSQIGQPKLCVDPITCIKGCICASGYLRAANGTCVPQDQCPQTGCNGDPNAHPGCGVNCGRTCSTYQTKNVACPLICNVNGCDCNDGYVYDNIAKKCVLPKDCTGCGGDPNAEPGCGYNCGRTCSSYNFNRQLCPRLQCTPDKCDCKDGYYLDQNIKKCVLLKDCTPVCGRNEEYSSCTNGGCGHRNCSQIGQPQICIDRTPESCTKGCICASGYLRAANGTCVPENQCPPTSCNGDPNAHPGCGVNCGRTCDTYKTKDVACILSCDLNGCDCNDGHVFDDVLKKCVLPENCTKKEKCDKPNEVYDVCPAPCPPRRCDVDDRIIRCAAPPQPGDPECKPGCRCADGYARNATGTCVLRKQCEKPLTCNGPNEQYDSCPAPCPGDSCDVNPALVLCAPGPKYGDPACKPACRCIDGYARNASQICIPRDQCPPPPTDDQCTGQNEFFDTCISGCSNQSCATIGKIFHCPIQPAVCRTGCRCKPGFYRNADYVCVAESECRPKATTQSPVTTTATVPVTTTNASPTTTDANKASDIALALAKLKEAIIKFTGSFLYNKMKAAKGQNVIASPCSVFTPMVQLALYTTGESLKQLLSLLNVLSKESIRSAFPILESSFDGQTSVNFSTVAKIYSDIKYPLSDSFKKDSVEVVHADAQELDFSKNTQAAEIINKWVESQTNNRIKDLIKPSDLSALTRLVLVNAIYFKGDWLYQFKKDNTKDADFYLSDGTTKKTKLMYQQATFNYGEVPELNLTVLEMPYKGRNFSMVVVLPNANDGALATAKNLQSPTNFNKMIGSLRSQKVKVYIPPFEINTQTDLAEILKQEGVTKIFDQKDSGLSGILKNKEDTYVSKAIQKAYVKVDENGSEAAAANGVIVGATSVFNPNPPKEIIFRCDRNFLFYLKFKETVLFVGTVVNPN